MSDEKLTRKTIAHTERLGNSANGNPRFRFHWASKGEGDDWVDGGASDLQSDVAFGYEVGNPGFRDGDTVDVKFSKAGSVEFMRAVTDA